MGDLHHPKSGLDPAGQAGQPLEYQIPVAPPAPRFAAYGATAVGAATTLIVLAGCITRTKFEKVFADFGIRLPRSTTVLIRFSRWLVDDMGWLVISLIAVSLLAGGILLAWMRPMNFTYRRERWAARAVWCFLFVSAIFILLALFTPMIALIENTK